MKTAARAGAAYSRAKHRTSGFALEMRLPTEEETGGGNEKKEKENIKTKQKENSRLLSASAMSFVR